MTYDTNVPKQLKMTQMWFASIISRRIDVESRMNPVSPTGELMTAEAKNFIAPSPTMESHERIELYNQQYWWRLMSAMQESFPFVLRLFGHYAFNEEIAIPYLTKYPSNSWSLSFLGKRLPQWIEENYSAKDKELVKNAAELDWCFNDSFVCGSEKEIKDGDLTSTDLESAVLQIQPYVKLFSWKNDLMTFREEFMKQEPEFWVENDFPVLEKGKKYYIVYRNPANLMSWKDLDEGEYQLLKIFEKGSTIAEACDSLEKGDPSVFQEAQNNLHRWFQEFIYKKWLFIKK